MKNITYRNSVLTLSTLVLLVSSALPLNSGAHSGPHGGVDTSPEPTGPSPFTLIVSGLSNPRGILIQEGQEEDDDKETAIYITEAGNGGTGPCLTSANGDYDDCYGPTGAITRVINGVAERVITGLPSLAGPTGGYAIGPARIVANGQSLFVSMANFGDTEERAITASADVRFGKLMRFRKYNTDNAQPKIIADISAFEDANDPDGDVGRESNPSGLSFGRGNGFYAVDAGANDLLAISPSGNISLRYVFPLRYYPAPEFLQLPPDTLLPVQAVPTAVVRGPDGAHYVSEFTGFPFPKGSARVLRFDRVGEPTVFADGFTNVIDFTFGPDDSLYVLEMATYGLLSQDVTGAVIKVSPDGTRTVLAREGLAYPTAIEVDRHGNVYVTNYGTSGGNG
ncbi:MAG: ScyD/ScyE family protein, partial [Gammaproteobacteria bacterium]|nr:ScyD/ScyE family protein [Gammaproteobacteria bacterium]